jgi:hypothetical protein
MSIFKSTFKPYVIRQINTRQNLLSEVNRPVDFNQYVSGKVPWIRMTSLVDYAENGVDHSPALAKKYILMGGTLYNRPGTDNYFSRSGVGGANAAYGGNLGTKQYGIRPMPGITSLKTRSLGAYGSLSEATINFQAWDVKQLEDLSILFLRPGYKVLLEWGWSMYLDTSINGESYKSKATTNSLKASNTYLTRTSTLKTIDCFDSGITQEGLYDQLDILRHNFSGNYDGVLGSIMNFDYTLMPNGSYECTTVLISIGDTIDTIRMNDTLGDSISPISQTGITSVTSSIDNQDYSEIKSQFELLMDEYVKLSEINPRTNSSTITAIDSTIKEKDKPYIDTSIYKYKSGFSVSAANNSLRPINSLEFAQSALQSNLSSFNTRSALGFTPASTETSLSATTINTPEEQAAPVSQDNPGDKRSYYYIQFAYLLHILNVFKNVFASKSQTLIDIEIPGNPNKFDDIGNGLCQASYNSISIDPNVAIIRNSKATLFTDVQGGKGFRPEIFKTEKQIAGPNIPDYNLKEYLYDNTNLGQIGNIYVNIKEIISVYRQESISNKGYVYVGKVISEILTRASYALGSINDFDKFIKDNKIVIIDKHYTELPADAAYDSKFKINVSGNNSIVRNHKIQSKIFPSQATMIAIAAQDRENISAIQTSTYNYLNKGLKDRLFANTATSAADADSADRGVSEIVIKRRKLVSILLLIQFVNNYVMVNKSIGVYYNSNIVAMNGYLNTLLVEMEGGTDYKAVVPISVDLTTDGLSGLTIGEIFTVDKKVLPKDYENKAVGFIITGISNEVASNGWTTNLISQMCLLDQEEKQILSKKKGEEVLKNILEEAENKKTENLTSVKYFNILAALVMDCLLNRFQIETTNSNIKIRNTAKFLYVKSAILDYSDGLLDFEYVLRDLNRAYLKAFPDGIYDIDTKTRVDNINNPMVLTKVISELSIYYAMINTSKEVGLAFNNEYYKIMNGYTKYVIKEKSNFADLAAWGLTIQSTFRPLTTFVKNTYLAVTLQRNPFSITTTPEDVKNNVEIQYAIIASNSTTFSKIDINKVVDVNTGLFNGPITSFFISGYKYYKKLGSNANQDQ